MSAGRRWAAWLGARLPLRTLGRGLRAAVFVGILAYLVREVWLLGFKAMAADMPASPWVYVLFFIRYFVFTLFEILIYQGLFSRPLWHAWPVFLRKRVLNFSVLEYSGEAYFYYWARRESGESGPPAFALIKDVNILSSLASIIVTFALLGAAAASGRLSESLGATPALETGLAWAALLGGALVLAFLAFRRQILWMGRPAALRTFGLHSARLVTTTSLQAAQWSVALPFVPLTTWLGFLALYMALTRLPFLPGKDLVFVTASVALAGSVAAPETAVAAMFFMGGVLMQGTNLVLFALTGMARTPSRRGAPGSVDQDPPRKG